MYKSISILKFLNTCDTCLQAENHHQACKEARTEEYVLLGIVLIRPFFK